MKFIIDYKKIIIIYNNSNNIINRTINGKYFEIILLI